MRALGLLATAALLLLPGQAVAGTVTQTGGVIAYASDPAATAGENVDVGEESGVPFVYSELGATSADCTAVDEKTVACTAPATAFVVNLLGFDDYVRGEAVTGTAGLEAHTGAGTDSLTGTKNADLLDGGPGENYYYDLAGDDTVLGGPNNDTWHAGLGRDAFSGGDGGDTVHYDDRTGAVTITLDGVADDGELGEGDNVGADVEAAYGGSGADRIVAGSNSNGARLIGGAGNDSLTGGPLEDRIEGSEGDDVIDSRDGRYDSVDCGAGNDTVLADLDDTAENCEVAPDRDGDGHANEADCEPDNPFVHPAAAEIFGNPTDEDCKDGPQFFTVALGFSYDGKTRKNPPRVRFTAFSFADVQAGDRLVVTCRGRSCPFKTKSRTVSTARAKVSLLKVFKKRFLRVGTVIDVAQYRANQHARLDRLKIKRGPKIKRTKFCVLVGQTQPGACPAAPS
jgi:hypothetical protein